MDNAQQEWHCPTDCRYSADHLWVRREGVSMVLGVTDYLQDTAGAILYIQLPAQEAGVDVDVARGEQLFSLEAAKWVGHFGAPAAGRVVAVNEVLRSRPGLANEDPYGSGWLVRLRPVTDSPDWDELMTAQAYQEFLRRQVPAEEEVGGA